MIRTTFMSRSEILGIGQFNKEQAIISITDPRRSTPKIYGNFFDILFLKFDDFEKVMFDEVLMDNDDALEIAQFIDRCTKEGVVELFIHCEYGRSRSVACCAALRDKLGFICQKHIQENSFNKHVYKLVVDSL